MQTYWLTGAKEAYLEHANILEAKLKQLIMKFYLIIIRQCMK